MRNTVLPPDVQEMVQATYEAGVSTGAYNALASMLAESFCRLGFMYLARHMNSSKHLFAGLRPVTGHPCDMCGMMAGMVEVYAAGTYVNVEEYEDMAHVLIDPIRVNLKGVSQWQ